MTRPCKRVTRSKSSSTHLHACRRSRIARRTPWLWVFGGAVGVLTALAADGPEVTSALVALAKGARNVSVGGIGLHPSPAGADSAGRRGDRGREYRNGPGRVGTERSLGDRQADPRCGDPRSADQHPERAHRGPPWSRASRVGPGRRDVQQQHDQSRGGCDCAGVVSRGPRQRPGRRRAAPASATPRTGAWSESSSRATARRSSATALMTARSKSGQIDWAAVVSSWWRRAMPCG